MVKEVSLAVDMHGCPNRCHHCWLGHMQNYKMAEDMDQWIVGYFQPYFDTISYYSWLREPDYCNHYKERWERDCAISIGTKPLRFELASFYRLVRDPEYVHFLKEVDTKIVQLTFFGLDETTDRYVGRKGAYQELLQATEILIKNEISPRWQAFINEENKMELVQLLQVIEDLDLYKRCEAFGGKFSFFVHAGSADGENRKLYPLRMQKGNVPKELIPYYLDYDQCLSEQELYELLKEDTTHVEYSTDNLVLYISNQFDVYFNFTHMLGKWKIGNMKEVSSKEMMRRIYEQDVEALQLARNITIGELVTCYGNPNSLRLFEKSDYVQYLLNTYIEEMEK